MLNVISSLVIKNKDFFSQKGILRKKFELLVTHKVFSAHIILFHNIVTLFQRKTIKYQYFIVQDTSPNSFLILNQAFRPFRSFQLGLIFKSEVT